MSEPYPLGARVMTMRFVPLPPDGDQPDPLLTSSEIVELWTKAFQAGWTKEQVYRLLKGLFQVDMVRQLRKSQLPEALCLLERRER